MPRTGAAKFGSLIIFICLGLVLGVEPVLYYSFDEGSGTTFSDAAGGNTGSLTGATTWTTSGCARGSCLHFLVRNDKSYLPIAPFSFIAPNAEVTLMMFLYGDSAMATGGSYVFYAGKPQFIINWAVPEGGRNYFVFGNGNGASDDFFINNAPTDEYMLNLNHYAHVIQPASNSHVVYRNGELYKSGTTSMNFLYPPTGVDIGAQYIGKIDELRLYDVALTQAQIQEIYNDALQEDECLLGIDDCDANAVCSDTTYSFTCSCDANYYGDG
eukprot:Rmarinus@m.13761